MKQQNTGVLCEVYDGQFHKIIVRNENGEPLTRLQHVIDTFKETMRSKDRMELINELLMYSAIAEDDVDHIGTLPFTHGLVEDLDSVKVSMNRVVTETVIDGELYKEVCNQVIVSTIPVNCVCMNDIRTEHRSEIWKKYARNKSDVLRNVHTEGLTSNELKEMIEGTKVHRRLTAQYIGEDQSEISEISDASTSDSDYVPSEESEISDIEEGSSIDITANPNISSLSTTSIGQSCIVTILKKLQEIDNKHKWSNENIDSFMRKFLSSKRNISKLFKYEMDIVNNEIMEVFGKCLFKKNDSKQVRVNKIYMQLRQMPELLQIESSDNEIQSFHQPQRLFDIYLKFLCSSKYPKEYLAASVCKINHLGAVKMWESRSPIPVNIRIPFLHDGHIIFSYPEVSSERKQIEMRTFDYTHILNNLRFHICNRGFQGVSTEAFKNVSKVNHDVLPLTNIVEDKLDRQNCDISKRFFSEEVEKILRLNGDISEAEFVSKTRNWYRACDERGMDVKERVHLWNDMYSFLVAKCNFSDYPPPTTHIQGIPIKTYEALLHTTSTQLSLYGLSTSKSYNTRAISTLAVESFFSDLTRYEFSGLGAPKSVDIPKLISHVVHINTTKHNPDRGFEFTTSTRDNYPVYLMENNITLSNDSEFQMNLFDLNNGKKEKKKTVRWFTLAKPKHVVKGGRGI